MTTVNPQLKTLTPQINFGQQTKSVPLSIDLTTNDQVLFGKNPTSRRPKMRFLAVLMALVGLAAACGSDDSADDNSTIPEQPAKYSPGTVLEVGSCDNGNNGLVIRLEQNGFGDDHYGYLVDARDCDDIESFDVFTQSSDRPPMHIYNTPGAGMNFHVNQEEGTISLIVDGQEVIIDAVDTGNITVDGETVYEGVLEETVPAISTQITEADG